MHYKINVNFMLTLNVFLFSLDNSNSWLSKIFTDPFNYGVYFIKSFKRFRLFPNAVRDRRILIAVGRDATYMKINK